jgi:hypothetical protein
MNPLRCKDLVIGNEHTVHSPSHPKRYIDDVTVDEGVIRALIALGLGVIVGAANRGQRNEDQQRQR